MCESERKKRKGELGVPRRVGLNWCGITAFTAVQVVWGFSTYRSACFLPFTHVLCLYICQQTNTKNIPFIFYSIKESQTYCGYPWNFSQLKDGGYVHVTIAGLHVHIKHNGSITEKSKSPRALLLQNDCEKQSLREQRPLGCF